MDPHQRCRVTGLKSHPPSPGSIPESGTRSPSSALEWSTTGKITASPEKTHKAHSVLSNTLESHSALRLGSLHPEGDVNLPVELVHLSADPWEFLCEVYLIPQNLSCLSGSPEGVERTVHNAR